MTNPIMQLVANNHARPISTVACERRHDGRWVASIKHSGMDPQSCLQPIDGVTISVRAAPAPVQCLLPPGISSEVVETWIREVAEMGEARDFARNGAGDRYWTFPLRWGSVYRKLSAELTRVGYVFGDTYPIRKQLKAAGLKWAPKRKAWVGKLGTCQELAEQYSLTLWTKPPACKLVA